MTSRIGTEQDSALRKITASANQRIRELETKLAASEEQRKRLQKRAEKLEGGRHPLPLPVCAGILQRTPITRAVILYPRGTETDVVPLHAGDAALLDIDNRDRLLSCDMI